MRNTLIMILLVLLMGCQQRAENTQQTFFDNLSNLCGQTFTGFSTYPDDPDHDFAGKLLRANFMNCDNRQIRIKFDVGNDLSRTWYITRDNRGLLLKHDHRHSDGSPDEITNYGGWANDQGTPWSQYFMADDETAALIPAATTNVWMLRYDPASEVLTYDLKRHNKPRYQAQLKPIP
ncbi:hypothetical protein OS175_04650 [Marinicella sp. S1101]|uniref:hypothetical protein n=1 Tax=Marinicella marina TaxID=2996016 RepID=UPI002260A7E1|nr:hypothetical protein [Marinicella marina]MCX7553157.1 hypothetical protein [Marinicella marina]MDJ1138889.1 hypothetical protein [Marinicella marina]